MKLTSDMRDLIEATQRDLRAARTAHALATVVRTQDATSAKAGAKAVVAQDGEILAGWVGSGCARGAIGRAARRAIETGAPIYVALRPDEALREVGAAPCEARDGIVYERNGCASKGAMDIFVDPWVPVPDLVVLGESPVAEALERLASMLDLQHADALPQPDTPRGPASLYVVVATQGRGDAAALTAALAAGPDYLAFVGSRRKFDTLAAKLVAEGAEADRLAEVSAPAGLDIGAANAAEIALSIIAEITRLRRKGAGT